MSVTHATALRVDQANLATGVSTTYAAGASQKVVVYSGKPQTGTIAITSGAATVTGTGTAFTTALVVGQSIQFVGDTTSKVYTILSIASDTSLTLTANYAGSTLSGSAYVSAPLNAATALSSNTAIATVSGLVWGTNSAGTVTLSSSTPDSGATGGTAMFYRRTKSDGSTAIEQGLCGTSGSDLNMSSLTIANSAVVSITSGSYTATP